jgi:hypothetical protein
MHATETSLTTRQRQAENSAMSALSAEIRSLSVADRLARAESIDHDLVGAGESQTPHAESEADRLATGPYRPFGSMIDGPLTPTGRISKSTCTIGASVLFCAVWVTSPDSKKKSPGPYTCVLSGST